MSFKNNNKFVHKILFNSPGAVFDTEIYLTTDGFQLKIIYIIKKKLCTYV